MVKAVQAHADVPWVVLYVRRWLSAPLALPDGTLRQRDRGTPQGSAVSPVLANLFMHYAFDAWMVREYPNLRFERYADDVVVHCVTERQARTLVAAIGDRMEQVGLRLHPDKTKVVYCQDGNRRLAEAHPQVLIIAPIPGVERVMHEQVGQHRRDRGPLRGAPVALLQGPVGQCQRRAQPPLDIQHHPRNIGMGFHRLDGSSILTGQSA